MASAPPTITYLYFSQFTFIDKITTSHNVPFQFINIKTESGVNISYLQIKLLFGTGEEAERSEENNKNDTKHNNYKGQKSKVNRTSFRREQV